MSQLDNPLISLKSEAIPTTHVTKRQMSASQEKIAKTSGSREIAKFKHGLSTSSTYTSWEAMHKRCRNRNAVNFADYGGRGIRVCKRWSGPNGFWSFLLDMGERPDGLTLDRIDVNRGYNRHNCRWATKSEQQRNRRWSRQHEGF